MVQLYGATEANRILNTENRLKSERIQKTKSQKKLVDKSVFLDFTTFIKKSIIPIKRHIGVFQILVEN